MRLLRAKLLGVGPFQSAHVSFADEAGVPRAMTAVHGGGGVGKTSLLSAIASTRPGNTSVQQVRSHERQQWLLEEAGAEVRPSKVICEWSLGQDDPDRPHPLVVASPNARVYQSDEQESLRRREQAVFDKLARDLGFCCVHIPSSRWFSRQPMALHAPARTLARYDVRASYSLEDRTDLARETKQALAYATIGSALAPLPGQRSQSFDAFGQAMRRAVDRLAALGGYRYLGLDPVSLEPVFQSLNGNRVCVFDMLPNQVRHLVAFVALPLRALWAARPERDPQQAEAVVLIDDVDLYQDPGRLAELPQALYEALPAVQWIVTATSPLVAGGCETSDVVALRRAPEGEHVELHTGAAARVH